jgi:hypothetical protein
MWTVIDFEISVINFARKSLLPDQAMYWNRPLNCTDDLTINLHFTMKTSYKMFCPDLIWFCPSIDKIFVEIVPHQLLIN